MQQKPGKSNPEESSATLRDAPAQINNFIFKQAAKVVPLDAHLNNQIEIVEEYLPKEEDSGGERLDTEQCILSKD